MTKVERDALRWVNKIRRCEGRKTLQRLPKGDPSEIYSCPLARALDHGHVGVSGYLEVEARRKKKVAAFRKARLKELPSEIIDEYEDEVLYFNMPPAFAKFITWFDSQRDVEAEKLAR